MKLEEDKLVLLQGCTRVEVIDETGRAYVHWESGNIVQASLQDNGRTIKLFISNTKQHNGNGKN